MAHVLAGRLARTAPSEDNDDWRMPIITFEPFQVSVPCADGESVFDVARRHGIPIATACSGQATCGLCRVKVVSGEAFLPPFGDNERKHLGNVYFITKERLACQARVSGGDVVIAVPPLRKIGV
jgi:2Fe-2S ferredoxin